jgi:hypothetical protein
VFRFLLFFSLAVSNEMNFLFAFFQWLITRFFSLFQRNFQRRRADLTLLERIEAQQLSKEDLDRAWRDPENGDGVVSLLCRSFSLSSNFRVFLLTIDPQQQKE